ncbi:MAG: outer membrane beta-barrel protein [Telluria sp.]
MNKNTLLATLLLSSSCAIASPGYVGINVGTTTHTVSFDGDSGSENTTGARVYGGYQVSPRFGMEAGYVHFGKVSETEDGLTVNFKPTAIYAAVTGTMPVSPSFNLFGKLGVSRNSATFGVTFENDSVSMKKTSATAMFGIGVQYKMSDSMSLVAEYENFGKVAKFDEGDFKANFKAQMISIGLRNAF